MTIMHASLAGNGGEIGLAAQDVTWGRSSPVDPNAKRSFQRCVSAFRPDLYRYALWLTGDPSIADDAVQEALIRGWRSWHKLKDPSAAKPWLCTIVRRESARLFERKRLVTRDIDALTDAEQHLIATADDEPELVELRRAIFALDPLYREPLVLQVLMGHSAAEIAAIIGIKQGAVLTRLCRARQKLAAHLKPAPPSARHSEALGGTR